MKTDTVTLPAHWASALINNDFSGLSADDAKNCRGAVAALRPQRVVSIADDSEPRFTWQYRLYDPNNPDGAAGGEVLDYVTLQA